jgi:hypothetical protein
VAGGRAVDALPDGPLDAALPVNEIVDNSFTVSSCPAGQVLRAPDSLIGRLISKVSPQARQRYSYRGMPPT